MIEWYQTIKQKLRDYGIPLKDFYDALEGLELFCASKHNNWDWVGLGATALSIILLPAFLGAIPPAALALFSSSQGRMWGLWENIIQRLQELIWNNDIKPLLPQ